MSVWRSPVFYFGVLLSALVLAALAAPFLVNWDAYKTQLEDYGQDLTGREVVIAGDVDARLFPWPRLTASNVIIANEEGFGDAPLLAADAMTARFSLAGLFSGSLQVEEIEFDAPQLNLVRNGNGAMNWTLRPAAKLQGLLSRVKLDRITIRDGGVWFEDKQRKQGSSLTAITASLSAQELEGPWRLNGTGQWRDTELGLSFTTGSYEPSEGLRMGFTATPVDSELPVFSLDGVWRGEELRGQINLSGQQGGAGKGSIQDKFRPLALQSEFILAPAAAQFSRIRIAPVDKKDSGTLIEGRATVDLASGAKVDVALSAPRINLDAVLGAGSQARWRNGGLLAVANSIFAELPDAVEVRYALDASVLTAGGEALNDVSLKGTAERAAIRINNASAQLPGRTRARFDGVIFPNPAGAEMGGTLALDSSDLRTFAGWMLPAAQAAIAQRWKGARGRLKMEGKINWSPDRLSLEKAAYELDGLPGAASMNWRFGEVPQIDLAVETKMLDLDAYLQGPGAAPVSVDPLTLLSGLPAVLELGQVLEHRIALKADSLTLNGAAARNVAADYAVGLVGLEIKTLEISSASGAQLKGEGLVTNGTDGPLGEINLSLKAPDVEDFMQLAGFAAGNSALPWRSLLGQTAADFTIAMDAEQARPRIGIRGKGSSGQLNFLVDATLRDLGRKQGPLTAGAFEITAADAGPVLAVMGFDGAAAAGPVKVKASVQEDEGSGFNAQLSADVLASNLSYTGKLAPGSAFWGADGILAVEVSSLARWFEAAGLPRPPQGDAPLKWQGKLKPTAAGLTLERASGASASGNLAASFTLDTENALSADLELDTLELPQALAWSFMPWRGGGVDLQNSFSAETRLFKSGQIFLRPKVLTTGLGRPVREAVIGISATPGGREISVKAPGKTIDAAISVKPDGLGFKLAGKGRLAVDLGSAARLDGGAGIAAGTLVVEGEVSSSGRSPAAALQAMQGKGVFWLEGASLSGISVNGFAKAISAVATPAQLGAALAALESPRGTLVPAQTGALAIREGVVAGAAIAMRNNEESLAVAPQLDLSTGELTIKANVQSQLRPDLPPVVFTYAGPPEALRLRKGSAALAAKLGYELMSQEMAKLEKLQQEEQAILQREERQRQVDQQRFEDYQLQRAELRQRLREQHFFEMERARLEAAAQQELRAAIIAGDAINRVELAQRLRELAVRRLLAEPLLQP